VNCHLHWYIAIQPRCFALPGCKLADTRNFHFMKYASLAAVFVALMAWHALAANPPAHPADELWRNGWSLSMKRR
jgi:hypothetical protein